MSRAPFTHFWGAPDIRNPPVAPPARDGYPGRHPLPFHALKFNPLGLYDLRRRLGILKQDPSIWNTYRRQFLAGDIAWLASGASDDNLHDQGFNTFFPELKALRDSLPSDDAGYTARGEFTESARKVIWDLATMLDRTLGSTTMILHVPGTTVPGTPLAPEYLRASVYLPPAFIHRHPETHPAIAQIAQSFLEFVGVATVATWVANARREGWKLTQTASNTIRPNSAPDHLIPDPKQPGSSHYIFRGLPAGRRPDDVTPPSPTSTRYGSEEPLSAEGDALLTALERVAALEGEVHLLHDLLDSTTAEQRNSIRELTQLQAQLNAAEAREEGYEEERRELQRHIGSQNPRSPAPPTYNASSQATPTRSRGGTPFASPSKTSVAALPRTTEFLKAHGLLAHLPAIRMMIRHAPATKWFQDIAGFDLDELVAEELLECLTQECL
ncbi:hypothetical protein B0H16DRAFT_1467074 [Mycena metata]|uniref:Uncharacterized protein n=1 Tax=Mycena metata TaxID=1033252 RepID=A0AAD7I5B2_9AGAR|nr:hypothetical protein B0H16DRAFT_1467074 [Mycena metata]